MSPTSVMCRAQEAFHRDRAARAVLSNVRDVAAKAAIAWGHEASLAEARETRQEKTRAIANALASPAQSSGRFEDLAFSENPDRGLPAS